MSNGPTNCHSQTWPVFSLASIKLNSSDRLPRAPFPHKMDLYMHIQCAPYDPFEIVKKFSNSDNNDKNNTPLDLAINSIIRMPHSFGFDIVFY